VGEGREPSRQIEQGSGMSRSKQSVVLVRQWCSVDAIVVSFGRYTGSYYKYIL
jgi:hypothetical protein